MVSEYQVPAPHSDGDMEEPPDFYLAHAALHNIYIFRAEIGDFFNSFTSSSIHSEPVEIAHSYVRKIWALLERQILEAGGKESVKVFIAQKIFLK